MKRLFIDEIDNMRDLGGYITKDGKIIKNDYLIRSNLPKKLAETSIEYLINKKITTIIDLRNDEEVSKNSGVFFNNKNFNYNHIKIKGDGRLPKTPETVYDSYIEILEGKEEIGKVFRIIAKAVGGVIYYCNAGKDRTGIISALILKLLNIDDKDIVVDYIASGVFLTEMLNDFARNTQIKNIKDIITPKKETMFRVLEYIEKEYNTIENYLQLCGVTLEELERIKLIALR